MNEFDLILRWREKRARSVEKRQFYQVLIVLCRFGEFAGYAGMVDMLHALGDRLLAKGFSTPLLVHFISLSMQMRPMV